MLWGFFIFKAKGNIMEDDTTTMQPAAPADDTMAPAEEPTHEEAAPEVAPEHTEETAA
jgi:hypothetical protein